MPPRTSTRCKKPPIRFVEVDSSEEGSPTKKQRLTQPSRDLHCTAESEDGSLEYETVISLNGSLGDSSEAEDEQESPAGTQLQASLCSTPLTTSVRGHLAESSICTWSHIPLPEQNCSAVSTGSTGSVQAQISLLGTEHQEQAALRCLLCLAGLQEVCAASTGVSRGWTRRRNLTVMCR